jgi:deoxyinosine 3'endonuclease (endonuclease V)
MVADATRFAAADVACPQRGGAVAALVIADDPTFATIVAEHTARLDMVAPYRPGAFFERELPALRAVLGVAGDIDLLVVDGYSPHSSTAPGSGHATGAERRDEPSPTVNGPIRLPRIRRHAKVRRGGC